jgi:phosphoglycerol transferase MdoB-like AlkP superfamily enzyme
LKRIKGNTLDSSPTQLPNYPITTITYVLFILLALLGIRGRVAIKSPIRWGTAFFSQYNFANQVGLNPVYTFMRSWLDAQNENNSRIHFMDEKKAIENVRGYYGMDASTDSPIANFISANGDYKKYNIVLVLMESMSAKNLTHFGNENHLTPNLDSLFDSGISFSNFYSDGNHTFNGIYSSLFGFPSLPLKHSLKNMENQQPYGGIAKTLLLKKYETIFFTTHDEQFDNMSGFLLPNGFETLVSQKDYSSDKIISTLGVPDHVQFDEVVKRVSQIHASGKQFFAGVMTASNHSPYIMPKNLPADRHGIPFKAHSSKDKTQMIEYADWAIGYFLNECKKQAWFDSTIFIFTGDHGNLIDGFEHYTAYHNIPFIIYAPKIFSPKVIDKLGGQIDIYPTVMSLLNLSFMNNSFGIDLFHDSRNFLPFTYDGELCCTDGKNIFVLNRTQESFYKISEDGKSISPSVNPALSDSMKVYSESIMQTLQWMIEKRMME